MIVLFHGQSVERHILYARFSLSNDSSYALIMAYNLPNLADKDWIISSTSKVKANDFRFDIRIKGTQNQPLRTHFSKLCYNSKRKK